MSMKRQVMTISWLKKIKNRRKKKSKKWRRGLSKTIGNFNHRHLKKQL